MNQILKNLVIKEAKKLKKFATEEELQQLNIETLDPDDRAYCIYGQMTDDCFSPRANDLILLCASKIYEASNINGCQLTKAKLAGKPTPVGTNCRKYLYFSPIEKALLQMGPRQKEKLIAFLKNETKILEL